MTVRITDNRAALAMTVDEADALFQQIAETVIVATADAARFEKRLAALKADAVAKADEHKAILRPLEKQLHDYINAHPDRFQKLRMRPTEFGRYGLRTVTNLEVTDPDAALASVKAQNIPAIVVTERLDRRAMEKAISDGHTITGAEIRTGEIMKYNVKKDLLDRVKG